MHKDEWLDMWKVPEAERETVWAQKQALDARQLANDAPAVVGDIQPFVSEVDGTVISSRAKLREHNLRNGVTLLADVKGLPPKKAFEPYVHSKAERETIKRTIWQIMDSQRN